MKTRTVQGQLFRMQGIGIGISLFLCILAFIVNDLAVFKRSETHELTTVSSVLAKGLVAPLMFLDKDAAEKVLRSLASVPNIQAVYLFDSQGQVFSHYGSKIESLNHSMPESMRKEKGTKIQASLFWTVRPVIEENTLHGTLVIISDASELFNQMQT